MSKEMHMKKVIILVVCAALLITGMSTGAFVVGKKKVKTPSLEECVDTLQTIEKVGTVLQELGELQQQCVTHAHAYTNKESIVCLKTAQQRQEFKALIDDVEDALDHVAQVAKKLNNVMHAQELTKEAMSTAKKAIMQN